MLAGCWCRRNPPVFLGTVFAVCLHTVGFYSCVHKQPVTVVYSVQNVGYRMLQHNRKQHNIVIGMLFLLSCKLKDHRSGFL